MMASTLAISVSRLLRPLSDNPSRKSLRLRADAATIASAYSYEMPIVAHAEQGVADGAEKYFAVFVLPMQRFNDTIGC